MRILFLGLNPFHANTGLATYNRALMRALSDHRSCRLLTYMPFEPLPAAQVGSGMLPNMQQVGTASTFGLGRAFRYRLNATRECRNVKYDIVICGHSSLSTIVQDICGNHPPIVSMYVAHVDAWSAKQSSRTKSVARCEYVVGFSESSVKHFCRTGSLEAHSLHVIPNCIDLYRYTPGAKDPILMARYGLRGKRVVMSLGRMTKGAPSKGYDSVLSAMPSLLRREPNLVYMCVGAGDDRDRLIAKAEHLGVGHHVIFPGKISEIEKIQHYRLADCFAMPGSGKAFGTVYLEAMACGVPVVASLADGEHESVLNDRLSNLVDPAQPGELEGAILQALHEPCPTPRHLLEAFSTQSFSERVQGIFEQAASTDPQHVSVATYPAQRKTAPLRRT